MKLQSPNLFRRLRELNGWSQRDMAELLAISPGMVAHIEVGRRQPSRAVALRIVALFQVNLPDLFAEEELTEYAAVDPDEATA